jgi:hypothetical protein
MEYVWSLHGVSMDKLHANSMQSLYKRYGNYIDTLKQKGRGKWVEGSYSEVSKLKMRNTKF